VQPLADESKLQNLNNLPLSDLRKDFYDQVLAFRRQIFYNLKIKTVSGKPISGYGLGQLLSTWIESINTGVVPNLENSFEQVAMYENERLVKMAGDLYDEMITEALTNKMPCDLVFIKDLHKEHKLKAVDFFKEKAIGAELDT
jgi:hypothetical protein